MPALVNMFALVVMMVYFPLLQTMAQHPQYPPSSFFSFYANIFDLPIIQVKNT